MARHLTWSEYVLAAAVIALVVVQHVGGGLVARSSSADPNGGQDPVADSSSLDPRGKPPVARGVEINPDGRA
jgi:hypothetical protein